MSKNKAKKQHPNPAKKTIGINTDLATASELERRAGSMHISKSKYCERILKAWLDSGEKLVMTDGGK